MSNLSIADKKYLDNALRLETGFIVRFNKDSFAEFFRSFNIDIYADKYSVNGESMTNRLHTFWQLEDNKVVAMSLLELASLFRNRELAIPMNIKFSPDIEKIANKLLMYPDIKIETNKIMTNEIKDDEIAITIRPEIYEHIKEYWNNNDYYHSVEESYKIVLQKLKDLTGEEQAHKAFCEENFEKIFGYTPENDAEKDFFEGVKFLNMAIQKFRNEKAHTPAKPLERNLALHYISLASLAYNLISKN
jgi:uncharacterized protein (TIGR02391 family)